MGHAIAVQEHTATGGSTEAPAPARALSAGAAVVGSVVAVLTWLRVAVTGHVDLLWAEDGGVFIADAVTHGPEALFYGYNGYAHLAPRLAGQAVALLPPTAWGVGVTIAASLVAGVAGAVVYRAACRLLQGQIEPAVVALLVALIPHLNVEAVATLSHLHWLLLYASVWVVLADDRPSGWIVAVTVASSPIALLLVPFAHRHWRWVVPGAVWQLATIAAGGRQNMAGVPGGGYLTDVAGIGHPLIGAVVVAITITLAATAARRPLVSWLLGASGGFFLVAVLANGQPQARYGILPALLLWAALAVAAEGRRTVQMGLAGLALVAVVVGFPASDFRTSGEQLPCGHVGPDDGWAVEHAPC